MNASGACSIPGTLVVWAAIIGCTSSVGLAQLVPRPASAPHMQSDEPAENETLLRGRVVDVNGNPIAGCHLAVLGDNRVHFPHTQVVFAETVSDADGRYQFSLQKEPLHKFASIRVVAHAEGMGWAWMDFSHNEPQLEILFTLTAAQPIRGRLLDGEGQPAIGITLRPFAVVQSVQEDGRDMYFPTVDKQSAALPQPVQTDDEGRFVIANIPSGHGVRLFSSATDQFSRHELCVNCPRSVSFGLGGFPRRVQAPYGFQAETIRPDQEVIFRLQPARVLSILVQSKDTMQPVAGFSIQVDSGEPPLSNNFDHGKTDEQGRLLLPMAPGNRFELWAFPGAKSPYLPPRTLIIQWQAEEQKKEIVISLSRGVKVKGSVVEEGTDTAVADASIRYTPAEPIDDPDYAENITINRMTDENGFFELPVPPMPGWLLVQASSGNYVLQQIGWQQLKDGRLGGRRTHVHDLKPIKPELGSEPIQVAFHLKRGVTTQVQLTDDTGKPVHGVSVQVFSLLDSGPSGIPYHRIISPDAEGLVEFQGLEESKQYLVHFHDVENQRGASIVLQASEQVQQVVLSPCGQATATLIDSEGNVLPNQRLDSLKIIVIPGVPDVRTEAIELGQWVATVVRISRTTHRGNPSWGVSNEQGRVVFPMLIPGATYQVTGRFGGREVVLKEFSVKSGESIFLGNIIAKR